MQFEELSLKELKPYERNPRKNDRAVDGVAESIKQFGFKQPIVIDKDNVIVAGHTRYKAAKKLKLATVPVVRADDLTEEQVKAYRILDNKLSEYSYWDFDLLNVELADLDYDFEPFNVEFSAHDVMEERTEPDEDDEEQVVRFTDATNGSLSEDYIIPPLSVLNTRSAGWMKRAAMWQKILRSGEGRKMNLLGGGGLLGLSLAAGQNLTGTSVFDPVLCEILYKWFCPPGGRVLDPFAGGSVRGVISGYLKRPYLGVDLSQTQIESNEKTHEQFQEALVSAGVDYVAPEWICDDARNIAQIVEGRGKFDYLISCPPYYDLEIYSDDPKDLSNASWDDFLRDYRQIYADAVAALDDDTFASIVIGEVRDTKSKNRSYRNLVGETVLALQDAGMEYYNELILVNNVATAALRVRKQFATMRKTVKVHQNVLVFVKGSAKKATEKLGDVEKYLEAIEDMIEEENEGEYSEQQE